MTCELYPVSRDRPLQAGTPRWREASRVPDKLDDAIARVEKLAESDPAARVKDAAARTLRVLRARK